MPEVARDAVMVITSYSLFRIDYDDYAECTWSGLFLDEAQFKEPPIADLPAGEAAAGHLQGGDERDPDRE